MFEYCTFFVAYFIIVLRMKRYVPFSWWPRQCLRTWLCWSRVSLIGARVTSRTVAVPFTCLLMPTTWTRHSTSQTKRPSCWEPWRHSPKYGTSCLNWICSPYPTSSLTPWVVGDWTRTGTKLKADLKKKTGLIIYWTYCRWRYNIIMAL